MGLQVWGSRRRAVLQAREPGEPQVRTLRLRAVDGAYAGAAVRVGQGVQIRFRPQADGLSVFEGRGEKGCHI